MKKILVTAFKPFNKSNNNYSSEVLKEIKLDVDKVILDVVYDESYEVLKSNDLNSYSLIIALGEARSRDYLSVEKQAKNISSCSIADNKGILKNNEIIDSNFETVLETKLNLSRVTEYASISYDAGKFVCNNLYFHLLCDYPDKSLFIHIPECNNELDNYKKYAKLIENIIENLK